MGTTGLQPSKRDQAVREIREHLAAKRSKEALDRIAQVPEKLRDDAEIAYLHALALERQNRRAEAVKRAEKSVRAFPRGETMVLLARCHRFMGNTEDALRWCDRAEEKLPGHQVIAHIRGGALEEAGRFTEATAVLEPCIRNVEADGKEPPVGLAVEWSKLLVQNKRYDEAIALIDSTLEKPEMPEPLKGQQLHLKAKALDRKKDFPAAWEAAESANGIGRIEFDPDLYAEQVSALIENWSAQRMADFPISSCDSELPVFVAGMPRSGTSLIDQIIDAHPKAAGVGELNTIERFAYELGRAYDAEKPPPDCFGRYNSARWTRAARDYVRELKKAAPPDAERVVNKALGNNKLVGLIARLFPNTRVIHAIRDPRDVAISCFMGGFNNRLHPWTTRVEWASHAWRESLRMMEHWKQTLDIPILDVHYERLVADPETEMPRIIDFLGLDWDDACREFYKSRRTVRTLSYDQVNRPLYTSSSGRHKNYADQIAGIDFPPYAP